MSQETIERGRKMLRGHADAETRNRGRGFAHYVEYICPRCKVDLDPDDTECVVCGYAGRPLKKVADE